MVIVSRDRLLSRFSARAIVRRAAEWLIGVPSAIGAVIALLTISIAPAAFAQFPLPFGEPPLVIENARIVTMDGPPIEDGVIIIRDGRVDQIGSRIEIPERATRIDARGGVVTPGLIDVHGALGLTAPGGGGAGGPLNRAADAFDRYATDQFRDAVRHGVTALYIPARGGGGINGVGAVIRLAPLDTGGAAGMPLDPDSALCIDLASNESAINRLNTFNEIRNKFRAAVEYREALDVYKEELVEYEKKLKERAAADKKKDANKDGESNEPEPEGEGDGDGGSDAEESKGGPGSGAFAFQDQRRRQHRPGPDSEGEKQEGETGEGDDELKKPTEPPLNRESEILLLAIDHELPVRVNADRDEDILNAIELAKEFRLDLIIEGAAEGWAVVDEIAEADAPVVLGLAPELAPRDTRARKPGYRACAAALTEAGIDWLAGTGAAESAHSRFVLANAMLHVKALRALDDEEASQRDALRLVTRGAAEFLGVDDQLGRIGRGRPADLVIWSGPPEEPDSRVMRVYIDGKLVYLAAESETKGGGEG